MSYVIFDLEFNHKHPDDEISSPQLTFEILQIGAIKIDNNYNTLAKFNALVKPTVHKTVHPYVENMTKINNDMLTSSKLFPQAFHDFIEFIGNDNPILGVWGKVDIKELIRNIKFHELSTLSIPQKYMDIQLYASKYFKNPKGIKISLKKAIELFNVEINGDFHDAFNDAFYTTEVFKNIPKSFIEPLTFSTNSFNRKTIPKEKIDKKALIMQFEKMYNRPMTEEEKSIIITSYMMGRSNQFIKIL